MIINCYLLASYLAWVQGFFGLLLRLNIFEVHF